MVCLSPPENLSGVAEAAFEFFGRAGPGCDEPNHNLAPILMATLQETLQALIRKWLDLDPNAMDGYSGSTKEEVATVLAWSLYGGALQWSRLSRRPPAGEAARRIVALLLRK